MALSLVRGAQVGVPVLVGGLLVLRLLGTSFPPWLPWLLAGSVLGLAVLSRVLRGRGERENAQGMALLAEGRYRQALASFERVGQLDGSLAGVGSLNRGMALLGLWRLEEAARAFASATGPVAGYPPGVAGLARPMRALASAMLGRPAEGLAFLADGAEALEPETSLARLALAARQGDWVGARALAGRLEPAQLTAWSRALHGTLVAWTAEQLDGARPELTPPTLLGETGLAEVHAVWPELAAFLARATADAPSARA